jgi:hypothetical protein
LLLIDTKVANRRPTVKFSLDQRPLGSSIFNIQQFFDIVVPRLDLRNENCCYKLSVIIIIFLTNVKASIIFEAAVAIDYVAIQILGDIFSHLLIFWPGSRVLQFIFINHLVSKCIGY